MKSEVCKSGFWGKKLESVTHLLLLRHPQPLQLIQDWQAAENICSLVKSGDCWVSFWNHCASISRKTFHPKITQFYKLTVRHHRSVIEPYFTFEHILPKSLTEIRIWRNLYARKYLDKSGIGEVWLKIPRVEAKFEIWSVSHKKHRPANSHFYDWILHGYGNCHSLNCPLIVSFIILTFGQIAQFCSKTIKFHLTVLASDPVDGTGWWWRKALEINPFSEKATQKLDQSAFSMDLFLLQKCSLLSTSYSMVKANLNLFYLQNLSKSSIHIHNQHLWIVQLFLIWVISRATT